MKKIFIGIGLSLSVFPIMVQAQASSKKENICIIGSPYRNEVQHDYFKNQYKYRIYREDDLKRKNPVGLLKIDQGKGYLENLKNFSLQEAERIWGSSKASIPKRGELPRIAGADWRVFNLVGIGYSASNYLDKRPKYFYVYAKVQNDRLTEYAVDGPNILDFTPKSIAAKEERAPF